MLGESATSANAASDGTTPPRSPSFVAVVVDWDRTFIDADEAVCATLAAVTSELLGEAFPVSATDRAIVRQMGEAAGLRLLTQDEAIVSDLQSRFCDRYSEPDAPRACPRPGALIFLKQLRTWGLRIVLLSMGYEDRVWLDLQRLEIEALFDHVLTAEDISEHLPSPAPLELATSRLGLSSRQVLYVCDSIEHIIGGRAAGLSVAALDHFDDASRFRDENPWLVATSFDELSRRLEAELLPLPRGSGQP